MRSSDGIIVSIPRAEHTILVVDDHEAKRYVTTRILNTAGFKTVEASSGQKALEMASSAISAIVLDVHLPDIDGFEVCGRLRANSHTEHLPIIHLSAVRIEDADKIEGLNAGADGYLVYPVEPAMLVATLQALIRARMAEILHHRSEQKFRAIYNQAQSGIALVDKEGKFREVNPTLLKILKYDIAEVINRPISDFASPENKDFVSNKTITSAITEGLWHEEFSLLDANGEIIYLEWSMSPYVENDFRVAVITNISDRIYLEQQKSALLEREKAARQAAERHNRTQNDFIAIISHELRNPLSSILLNAHILSRMTLSEEAIRCVEAIQRGGDTQATIISDLLDASQIYSGKLRLVKQLVDPVSLIKSSIESMKISLEQKSIQVSLDTQDFRLETMSLDPVRFQQIFWNIFNNAVKFSNPGGQVSISLINSENAVKLVIRDFGKGIEADFLERIFDKFSQSEEPNNRAHGSLGLGMAIVKSLVSLHGGNIIVKSEGPGTGTLVEVEFPIELPPKANISTDDIQKNEFRFIDKIHILLVEDDNEAAAMLALILEEHGAQVTLTSDFATAIQTYIRILPDLLISDIGLPGKDGYELIREIRKKEIKSTHIPAIALTAFDREADRVVALDAGFDIHLSKPIQPHLLLRTIHELLR